jgi:octaprenyl-diphosphate synthase
MNEQFNSTLKNIKITLLKELENVNIAILNKANSDVSLIPNLAQYIIASGGKRIRPILALLSAKMFAKDEDILQKNHIYIAAAVEFIHTATLLHDDVIDETQIRRSQATANNIWGNKASILVGDFLFAKAFELMVETNNIKVLNILSKASAIITEGEVLQLTYLNNSHITNDIYMQIIKSKTSVLFSSAAQSGAILAGATDKQQYLIAEYANNLGIAFQIIDDILDYASSEDILGKTLGADLKEGKITLPIILLLQQANKMEKKQIISIFENIEQNDQSFNIILNLINKYNIIMQCYNKANDYINLSLKNLENIDKKNIYFDYLYNLSFQSKQRSY